jgi:hypothetical protein
MTLMRRLDKFFNYYETGTVEIKYANIRKS